MDSVKDIGATNMSHLHVTYCTGEDSHGIKFSSYYNQYNLQCHHAQIINFIYCLHLSFHRVILLYMIIMTKDTLI